MQICNENDQVGQPIATFTRTHDTCQGASLAAIGNAVLTGATSGLGRLAALDLASKGARLGIVARDPVKAAALHREIDAMGCDGGVDVFIADMSSLVDVLRVGREISNHFERIDVLINNAGLHAFSQRVTAEGLAEMMAVNYLAPWVLTDSLWDTLVSSAPARVVNVASGAARRADGVDPTKDLTAIEPYTRRQSMRFYGRTKLMNIMFTQELGRRLSGTGVTANCCSPGFNVTDLGRELPFASALRRMLGWLHVGDPRRGASIIVHLATDPRFAKVTSGFFSVDDAKVLECPPTGSDAAAQRALWEATRALVETVVASDS